MKKCNMKIETPRGTFPIHTIFESAQEARLNDWGGWFQHEGNIILSKVDLLPSLKEGDSQFTESNLLRRKPGQGLQTLQGLTPQVLRPICSLRR